MMQQKWFIVPRPRPKADLRLICFPYAGGNASTYTSWVNIIPDNVELVLVQPPGRATRIFEQAYTSMDSLIQSLIKVIPSKLDKPYILFGHSLGSRVAFELMNKLKQQEYPLPQHFIASGSRGPQCTSDKKELYKLPDEDFIFELQKLNGTPKALLENKDLMDLLLPLIRADFELSDKYLYSDNTRFNCSVSVLGGEYDVDITDLHLKSWGDFFTKKITQHIIKGDHFYIDTNRETVLRIVNKIIHNIPISVEA